MDNKTITALQGSIAKWEKVAFHGGIDDGYKNCPLCRLFSEPDYEGQPGLPHCDGCPVSLDVGTDGCDMTPYEDWQDYQFEMGTNQSTVFDDKSKELAIKELEFLKSLLPDAAPGQGEKK